MTSGSEIMVKMSTHVMRDKRRVFVFIGVTPGKEKNILENLLKYDEVVEVHYIAGQYDVLAILEIELHGKGILFPAQEIITKFVIEKIRKLRYVQDTNTIIPTYSVTKRE